MIKFVCLVHLSFPWGGLGHTGFFLLELGIRERLDSYEYDCITALASY